MKKNGVGSIILFLAALIWGTSFVAQSLGSESVASFTFNGTRCLIGAFVLLITARVFTLFGRKMPEKAEYKKLIKGGIICGILLFFAVNAQQLAFSFEGADGEKAGVGKVAFLTAMYIVLVPVFSMAFGKKPGLFAWVSVAVAVAGAYFLAGAESLGGIDIPTISALISAVMFALQIIAVDKYASGADCIRLSMVQFTVCGILSMIVALAAEQPNFADIWSVKWAILYSGVMSSGVAYTLQMIGQKRCDSLLATLIMSLESVFSALSGWIFLGETLQPTELLGCGLMLAAVLLSQLCGMKKEKVNS